MPDIVEEEKSEDTDPESKKYIVCKQCLQPITSSDERINRDGSHRHTFANPNGQVFDIGCFRNAFGCGYAGQPSDEFTWFSGYFWRVCVCGMCLTHLGWLFVSGGDNFHGLILDRLIDSNS